jgi:hypothetical protein
MKRIHGFEFLDAPWYPQSFRCIQTDYLQFTQYISTLLMGIDALIPIFRKAFHHTETREIVDLCSGGTGSWIRLKGQFRQAGLDLTVTLTDKYPNPKALDQWPPEMRNGITYRKEPVDAANVPVELKGMRTLFAGFHHFPPDQAGNILRDAYEKGVPIGIFDPPSLRTPAGMLLLLLLLPVTPLLVFFSYWLVTPFIRPRTIQRFLWTYLLPIVPAVTVWDGVVSFLRPYTIRELKQLTDTLQSAEYVWESGTVMLGIPLIYLLGFPVRRTE